MVELKLSSDSLIPFNHALISQGCRTQYHKVGGLKQQDFIISWFWKLSSVQSLSRVQLFVTPWPATRQASMYITKSWNLFILMSIESVMPSNHLILCHPLLILPSVFPRIRVFSSESVLRIRWPKYWRFSSSISPANEYSGLISFKIDWFDLLAVKGTLEESSPTPQFKSINSLALSFLCSPTLTSIQDYWKNHSFDQTDLDIQNQGPCFL